MGLFFCEKIEQKDTPILKLLFGIKLNIDFDKFIKYLMIFLIFNIIFTVTLTHFIPFTKRNLDNLNAVYNFDNFLNYQPIKQLTIYFLGQIQNAVDEEIIFRLCFMNFIIYFFNTNKKKYWIGIIISSLFFALSHYQVTNEPITKLIQVLPLGIGLGIIYENFGLECAIISHLSFNLINDFIYYFK